MPPDAAIAAATGTAPVELKYVLCCLASFAFPALATIIKEGIFREAERHLGGRKLDVLVVNAFCSSAQVGGGVCVGGERV